MTSLVYHKRIKKQHNVLSEKKRYERKRERRKNRVVEEPELITSTGNNDEGMEVELIDENTITIDGNTVTIDSIPKEQVIKPPVRLNWFEKTLRKLFNKK